MQLCRCSVRSKNLLTPRTLPRQRTSRRAGSCGNLRPMPSPLRGWPGGGQRESGGVGNRGPRWGRRDQTRRAQAWATPRHRPGKAGRVSAGPRATPVSSPGEVSPRTPTRQPGGASRRPRSRPGSAASGSAFLAPPPSSRPPPRWELRAARSREAGAGREGGREAEREGGAALPASRGQRSFPAKATHLLLLHRSLQATDGPAGDALTPSPSPAAATEAAAPPRGGSGGLGTRRPPDTPLATPTGARPRPLRAAGLHAESLTQRPRGAGRRDFPHLLAAPPHRPVRFPVTPAPPPPLSAFPSALTPLVAASARAAAFSPHREVCAAHRGARS